MRKIGVSDGLLPMKAKTVSGYYVVNYGVSRDFDGRFKTKNGSLQLKGDYDAPATHELIMSIIRRRHRGWSITGYCPAKPLAAKSRPSVDVAASGKSLAGAAEVKYFYAVMKIQPWSSLTVGAFKLIPPPDGPCGVIAVFDTREQAIKWCDGDAAHVAQMSTY